MALIQVVRGVQREIWQKTDAQVGGQVIVVSTEIRIAASQLCRVQGLLVVDGAGGTPRLAAVPSMVNGRLVVTVTNSALLANVAFWTLDVRLVQSQDQATRGANGYILVAQGGTGLAESQTLAQTYEIGVTSSHQTMVIDTVTHGGGIIVNASTNAVTAVGAAFEVMQNAAFATPLKLSRRGDDAVSAVLEFEKARGTFAVPAAVQAGDAIGTINFTGYYNAAFRPCGRIESVCGVADEGFLAHLDFYSDSSGDVSMSRLWSMSGSVAAGHELIGYGAAPVVMPDTNDTGSLGLTTHIWAAIHSGNETLRHASADAVSSYLQFYKSRGTLAVPVDADLADALGTISFFGYRTGMIEGAKIVGAASGVGAGTLGGAIDFYTKATSTALARAVRIITTVAPLNQIIVTNPGQVVPDAWPNTSLIGDPNIPWSAGYFTNLVAARAATPSPAGGALGTLLFANNSVMPAIQANQVYLGSNDFVKGTNLAALAVTSEEPVVAIGANIADALVPIRVNNVAYYLLAYTPA